MIKSIPLSKLVPSSRNVRRSSDDEADARLKADIEARGLLQNLVVSAVRKPRGCFAVEAGGRRLAALRCLAEEGKLPPDHEVSCLVIDGAGREAEEISLAENFQRLSMNPADECLAFQQLIREGADVAGIARRFGLTERFVEGRLRLAGLAPVVFEALGSGEISLDVAKAYAATTDHERQVYVFEQMSRGYGAAHPDSIRRMMTQLTASGTDRRALFVGEEAYVAAGGRIERDLFSDEAATRWLDVALLERLATEKLEPLAAQAVAESGLGWVRPTLERWLGYADTEGLRRVQLEPEPLSEEEAAAVEALQDEVEELAATLEAEETSESEYEETMAKVRALNARIDGIASKPPLVDEDLKPTLGAFLMLDDQGRPTLDPARFAEIAPEAGVSVEAAGTDSPAGAAARKKPGLSQRLEAELAIQRRDILAVHVAADPAFALDLAAFLMADARSGYQSEKSGSSLIASAPSDPLTGFRTPEAAATVAAAEAGDRLDRSWTAGESRAERFDAFRALPEQAKAAWLGHCVARTLEASLNFSGSRRCSFHDHLGRLLGIDVARWWRPTAANYFDRVPKATALAALDTVGGASLASLHAGAKKADLAAACERIFAGDVIAGDEVKQAALAWVPEPMRFAEPARDEPAGAGAIDPAGEPDPDAASEEASGPLELDRAA